MELLERWEEDRKQGSAPTPEELCRDCPELLAAVRQGIRALRELGPMLTGAAATRADTPSGPGDTDEALLLPPASTFAGQRYRPLRFHRQGGQGEVFVAHDQEVGREVALKRIQGRHRGNPRVRRRFLREAAVNGRLEHPGIVPVYGLGEDAEGQPFYVMRLIQGETLQDALDQFHRADADAGRDAGERTVAFRQLLSRFVALCNAVAYAHSRGVVHRDLKPGNVMLGSYGETLLLDWGLAKELQIADRGSQIDRREEEGPPSLPSERSTDGSEQTVPGLPLGTPAYMSPEQARGEGDKVGPAGDTYSLGATLYALLTGQAPVTGRDSVEVLDKVRRGTFPRPRAVRRRVPATLEAVCLKAMALEPGDRYPSARSLADDVEHWLADEPVRAYREPLRLRLGRWARRHKPLVAALAVTALLTAAVAFAGWRWRESERAARQAEQVRQEFETRSAVEAILEEVAGRQRRAEWPQARAALERAEGRLGEGGPGDLRRRLAEVLADLELVARLDEIRQRRATRVQGEEFDSAFTPAAIASALRGRGLATDADADRLAEQVRASAVKDQLVAALDEWAWFSQDPEERARLLTAARRADPHPWRNRFRDPKVWQDQKALRRLADEAPLKELSPFTLAILASSLARTGDDQEAVLRRAQQQYPDDFWLNFDLALLLANRPRSGEAKQLALTEAVGFYRAAVAARPRSSLAYANLGGALWRLGKHDEVETVCRAALRLQRDNPYAYLNLSICLNDQEKYAEAEAVCRELIRVRPRYHRIYLNLSVALDGQGKLAESEAACRKAITLQKGYANSWNRLGFVLRERKKYLEAAAAYREALRLDPRRADAQVGLIDTLREQGKPVEAEAAGVEAVCAFPEHALAHLKLAGPLYDQGKLARAEAACREAIRLSPDVADAHSSLGVLLLERKRLPEALAAHREALRLDPRKAMRHVNYAATLRDWGDLGEAESACREALRLRPGWSHAYLHLGLVQLRMLHHADAEKSFRKAIDAQSDYAAAYVRLGDALRGQGKFVAALEAYRKGYELCRKAGRWPYPVARLNQLIQEAERLVELDARLPVFLKGEDRPPGAAGYLAVIEICNTKSLFAAAARFSVEAFAEYPEMAKDLSAFHRYNAACWAARAARGEGDGSRLDEGTRAGLRRQALDWLRADLDQWTKRTRSGKSTDRAAATSLRHWQGDTDLASVREPAALANLPDAERSAWQKLWADVEALRQRAAESR
jgi:tetratricopeptide (TPR) repeat protein/tRNA A-37 threonylcarbamoyl transferase component Bud32